MEFAVISFAIMLGIDGIWLISMITRGAFTPSVAIVSEIVVSLVVAIIGFGLVLIPSKSEQ